MKTSLVIVAAVLITLFSNTVMANEPDSAKVEHRFERKFYIEKDGKVVIDTTIVGRGPGFGRFTDPDFRGNRNPMHLNGGFGRGQGPNMRNFDAPGFRQGFEHADSSTRNNFRGQQRGFRSFGMPQRSFNHSGFKGQNFRGGAKMPIMHSQNGIDLNDRRIISFEKTTTKDGNEKIVIIRKIKD